MNKIKRRLSNEISSNEETKKLRSQLSTTIHRERDSINCIENLSNELFLEIFDYLDGCLLYDAFSNLNIRFQHLLKHSSLRFKITLTSDSKSILEHYSKNFIIPNKHQIISFRFNNKIDRFQVLSWFPIDSSFTHLESLTLNGIQSGEFALHLRGLVHLPRLFSLTISLDKHLIDIGLIYQLIFNLPKLKYYKFSYNVPNATTSSLKTNPSQFSSIEYLVMDHPCKLNDLITILSYTPRVSRLICKQSLRSNHNNQQIQLMALSKLTHLRIHLNLLRFNEFEIFIKSISSQLQVLKLYRCQDTAYLDADRWEKLILEHIPYLRKFQFAYFENINERLVITPYHKQISPFNSAFWIKKQWLFHYTIMARDKDVSFIIYDVSLCGYRCVDFHHYKTNNVMIPYQPETSAASIIYNSLFVVNPQFMNFNKTLFDIVRPVLFIFPIHAMNIRSNELFVGTLIELIRSLPNLESLAIRSLAMTKPRCLSVEEMTIFRSVSNNNKIMKVNLQQFIELAQIQFLIDLCPHLRHLEVHCSNDVNPETFLRFIFTKDVKYIPNLSSLCLRMSKLGEDTIQKLQKIIDLENLRRDYTIEQKGNGIYLQWNKQ